MIDYLIVRKTDSCLVKDVNVISSEGCVPQHRMVIGRLVIPMKPYNKKIVKVVPKPRMWHLKDEETSRLFTHEIAARNDDVTKADDIQKKWLPMKEIWLKASKQVCRMTKGPPRHNETWWWNRHVEEVVAKQKVCHKAWRKSKSAEDKHTLDVAKKEVYTAVLAAQKSKSQEFTADLQSESGRRNYFRIVSQMAREGIDIISMCSMQNDVEDVVSDADGMKNLWRKYMEKLLNVKNDWDGEVDCPEVMGPCCFISEK